MQSILEQSIGAYNSQTKNFQTFGTFEGVKSICPPVYVQGSHYAYGTKKASDLLRSGYVVGDTAK